MGERAEEEILRSADTTQLVDRSLAKDPRFEALDKMVERVYQDKELRNRTVLERERVFLKQYQLNETEVHAELRKSGFFKGRNDFMIESLVVKRVRESTNSELFAELEQLIGAIDFRFLEVILKKKELIDEPRKFFLAAQRYLLNNGRVRERYIGSFAALRYSFIKKYLQVADKTSLFIDTAIFEPMTKQLSKNEIVNLARIAALMQAAVYIVNFDEGDGRRGPGRNDIRRAYGRIKEKYPSFPDTILRIGLSAALPYRDYPNIPALAQYCAIITSRCNRYVPSKRQDRGAKAPDESWFSIAARNNDRHGFNPTLLLELRKLAAINGW